MTATTDERLATISEAGHAVNTAFDHRKTAPEGTTGLKIGRVYTSPGVHPYDEVVWENRDISQKNWKTEEVVFEQKGIEFPDFWSVNASTIVATKYFRGHDDHGDREFSLKQLIDRVVNTYADSGRKWGYFASEEDAMIFTHELTYMLLHQIFSFNSPVWFNVGTKSPQQVSACFILAVDDSMDSILNWYREEGLIFKGGSGAGLNLSRIRSSKELLSSGGNASGPVSFMRGADASAGTIKSGGATRRAAKMVVLDVDHPDIADFVRVKADEEKKIRWLREGGFDMDLGGKDIVSVQYQNANNSVRLTDKFMRAVVSGGQFDLTARGTSSGKGAGDVIETIDAKQLWDEMATAAWECADPGLQYDDTINDWHTNPETGRITASNPCSEYMSLDNSSCNLASLNLLKFLSGDGTFEVDKFIRAVEIIYTAMDISICFADFPTEAIGETTRKYRQLGIGYANLGALLMASSLPYDSNEGRGLAAAITSLLTGVSYRRSAELAGEMGPYEGFARNRAPHERVMRKHEEASNLLLGEEITDLLPTGARTGLSHASLDELSKPIARAAAAEWATGNKLGHEQGWRNAQASLLAPTGTIGFMMDCDTTGIEPDFSLIKFKKLVGGGSMKIVNQTIPRALTRLGYDADVIEAIVKFIEHEGTAVGAKGLDPKHYPIFDCAMGDGERVISAMGHVLMMAATQPFLSGAISKTVNLPEEATLEEVEKIFMQGWALGLKALAIYRDKCKVGQPLSDGATKQTEVPVANVVVDHKPVRRRLPKKRSSQTISFSVGGAEGYMTAGTYPDGQLGEVFLKLGKQGSTLAGVMDAFSIAISIALQYGVPLEALVSKFMNMQFEPTGLTGDPDSPMAKSIMDYIFRWLALEYLPTEKRADELGILTAAERKAQVDAAYGATDVSLGDAVLGSTDAIQATAVSVPPIHHVESLAVHSSAELAEQFTGKSSDAPLCMTCGIKMLRSGSCYVCEGCGSTSGCS